MGFTGNIHCQSTNLKFTSAGGDEVRRAVEENTELTLMCSYSLDDSTSQLVKVFSYDSNGVEATEVTIDYIHLCTKLVIPPQHVHISAAVSK